MRGSCLETISPVSASHLTRRIAAYGCKAEHRSGATQQTASWLEKLGLGQYAKGFAENDINFSILSDLKDQDLKEIEVSSLGHRRQLLRAIVELNEVEKGPLKATPPAATSATPQDAAERRQVTVMFSDLVGSTALSGRMDPEDLREVISAYQKCVAETVQRFGGFVAKYMGDGVLVYFGYPQAHEDDAERAVRAGLELVVVVAAVKSSVPLQARVGIATGLVVVGDLIGSGEAQERGIVGETWHRSGLRSGASFRMPCWLRWCASQRRSSSRRSTVSCRPVCYFGRACRRMRPICSNTLSCKTPPMARSCVSHGGHFTLVSPKRWKANSPRLPRANPNC
jgi:class 3 adenylate cyclase